MNVIHKLWRDENGFILSTEAMLFGTVLVLGTLVGLTTLRGQLVQELGDVGTALGNLNQSYSVAGEGNFGDDYFVPGSSFEDKSDLGEGGEADGSDHGDTAGAAPGGLMLQIDPAAGPGEE